LRREGILIILSSPSGAGKTSLARALVRESKNLSFSISATTRPSRPGEIDGREYYFVSYEVFQQKKQREEFLEWAEVFGNLYGTPISPVNNLLEKGKDLIFDVDWQGGKQIRDSKLQDSVISIFILPPSIAELKKRLLGRAQDSRETVKARMEKSMNEILHWSEYDYVLVNKEFETTLGELKAIINAEKAQLSRNKGIAEFVESLNNEFLEMES
jgi:guanylate kinase